MFIMLATKGTKQAMQLIPKLMKSKRVSNRTSLTTHTKANLVMCKIDLGFEFWLLLIGFDPILVGFDTFLVGFDTILVGLDTIQLNLTFFLLGFDSSWFGNPTSFHGWL